MFFSALWVCLAAVTLGLTPTGSDSCSPQSWRTGLPSAVWEAAMEGRGRQSRFRRAQPDQSLPGSRLWVCSRGPGLSGSSASWLGFRHRLTVVAGTHVPGGFRGSGWTWQPCPATSLACASGQDSFSGIQALRSYSRARADQGVCK